MSTVSQIIDYCTRAAEDLKKRLGMKEVDENIINKAMMSLIDMMAFETNKTISSYETASNQKVVRVLLVGGMVNMPNFLNYFKQRLGRDVFIGNALARVVYPKGLEKNIGELASTFAVAAGLAEREV